MLLRAAVQLKGQVRSVRSEVTVMARTTVMNFKAADGTYKYFDNNFNPTAAAADALKDGSWRIWPSDTGSVQDPFGSDLVLQIIQGLPDGLKRADPTDDNVTVTTPAIAALIVACVSDIML
jgi:hypothetical protein